MKKINIISIMAISISLLFTSCLSIIAADSVKGNGELINKTIGISDFSKIKAETQTKIYFSQGQNPGSLEFTVDENLWEYYEIYTQDDVLYIKLKEEFKRKVRLRPTKSAITVSSELLEKITIVGSSDFHFCNNFHSEKLSISITGSGDIFAKEHPVQIDNFSLEITGSGDAYLSGAIQKAEVKITGSGDISALNCEIKELDVKISGSGDVSAFVTDKLDVRIAGSGDVQYKGDPTVSSSISGAGKVKKL
jgi:hypothetical protein